MVTEDTVLVEEEARETAARRLATGKGVLLTERRNEQAERALTEQMTKRAKAGEHFPTSLRHG